MNYIDKLNEFFGLLNFNHVYYGKDFKNNYKFIQYAANKIEPEYRIQFIQDTIDIHKRVYKLHLK